MEKNSKKINVGLGVTGLLRSVSHGGSDGIGRYTVNLYNSMCNFQNFNLLPASFGYENQDNYHITGKIHLLREYNKFYPSSIFGFLSASEKEYFEKIDFFHSVDYFIPKIKKPVLATLHDAFPFSNPDWLKSSTRLFYRHIIKNSIKAADYYITVSNFAKYQSCEYYNIEADKVFVVGNSIDDSWFYPSSQNSIQKLISKLKINSNYILAVGTIHPRKNYDRIVKAFENFKKKYDTDLVIVGKKGWNWEGVRDTINSSECRNNIKWFSEISDSDLKLLYKGAMFLSFPSLAEGFGIPILEAFASGTPVLTSNCTSMPEIANDAALFVDPTSVDSIYEGMVKLASDSVLRRVLVDRGFQRVDQYRTKNIAIDLQDVYHKIL